MFYSWLYLMIILLIIEVFTINLVSIWFAAGAVAAMFASLFTDDLNIQIVVFLIISTLTLIIVRPIVNKYLKPKITKTNLDNVIGKTGVVTKEIYEMEYGEVKVLGKYWTAKAETDIKEGSKVEILAIDGVKLIVQKKKEEDK